MPGYHDGLQVLSIFTNSEEQWFGYSNGLLVYLKTVDGILYQWVPNLGNN